MAQLSYAVLSNMEAKQALDTYVQFSLSVVFLFFKGIDFVCAFIVAIQSFNYSQKDAL